MPVIKLVNRAHSTTADAYLTPVTREYIDGFLQGFKLGSENHTRIEFMQSDGGLVSFDKFSGLRAILSGPAGGVVGYARTCYETTDPKPVIGFDMVRYCTLFGRRRSSLTACDLGWYLNGCFTIWWLV